MNVSASKPSPASALLRLHGYPVSNYFNIAHAALIEKGVAFEAVMARAAQDEAFLAKSAMGKIPFLETPDGCVAETVAIIEYLEDAVGGLALLPADAFARARVRQVINIVQVYIEVPLRSLFPGVFMGGINDPAAVASARPAVERAMRALSLLIDPRPFLLGDTLTLADLFVFYCLDVDERVTRFVYKWPLIDDIAGLRRWYYMMAERPSSRSVLAAFAPAFEAYLKDRNAAWREPAHTASH